MLLKSRKEEDNKTQKKESNSQTQTEGSGEDSSTETKVYGGSVIVGITQDLLSISASNLSLIAGFRKYPAGFNFNTASIFVLSFTAVKKITGVLTQK